MCRPINQRTGFVCLLPLSLSIRAMNGPDERAHCRVMFLFCGLRSSAAVAASCCVIVVTMLMLCRSFRSLVSSFVRHVVMLPRLHVAVFRAASLRHLLHRRLHRRRLCCQQHHLPTILCHVVTLPRRHGSRRRHVVTTLSPQSHTGVANRMDGGKEGQD